MRILTGLSIGKSAVADLKTKRQWDSHIQKLRVAADAGDVEAMEALGLTLFDGMRDRRHRVMVRKNSRLGFHYLLKAATFGNGAAKFTVGLAYDIGLGIKQNKKKALLWYRCAARDGHQSAFNNIATIYRDEHNFKPMFQWWRRGVNLGNEGDDAGNVGYCHQYGIGTRRDILAARRMYKYAIESQNICEYDREAAVYHLAISYIDDGKETRAIPLLQRANKDNDYPEASRLLKQIESGTGVEPCRCRRGIRKTLPGHAKCPLHSRPR